MGLNDRGLNNPLAGLTPPGSTEQVRWYAGDIAATKVGGQYALTATPIEFGGVSLMPADKIKQGAKSLVGTLVVERQGASWAETNTNLDHQLGTGTRATRAMADVCPGGQNPCTGATPGAFRSLSVVMTKANTHYYRDSSPVEHINGEAVGIPEDSQESSGMALNYGIEPLWFRFGLVPQTLVQQPARRLRWRAQLAPVVQQHPHGEPGPGDPGADCERRQGSAHARGRTARHHPWHRRSTCTGTCGTATTTSAKVRPATAWPERAR